MFLYIGGVCCSDQICIYGGVFILEGPNFVGPCFEGPNVVGPCFEGPNLVGPYCEGSLPFKGVFFCYSTSCD